MRPTPAPGLTRREIAASRRSPVFVDETGRRVRRVRILSFAAVGFVGAYVVMLGVSLLGVPTIVSPLLPQPLTAPGTAVPTPTPSSTPQPVPSPRRRADRRDDDRVADGRGDAGDAPDGCRCGARGRSDGGGRRCLSRPARRRRKTAAAARSPRDRPPRRDRRPRPDRPPPPDRRPRPDRPTRRPRPSVRDHVRPDAAPTPGRGADRANASPLGRARRASSLPSGWHSSCRATRITSRRSATTPRRPPDRRRACPPPSATAARSSTPARTRPHRGARRNDASR